MANEASTEATVYVVDDRCGIHAIDAGSGELRWSYRPDPRAGQPELLPVAAAGGLVCAGLSSHAVIALDAGSGAERWANRLGDALGNWYSPVVAGGDALYVSTKFHWPGPRSESAVHALDRSTGAVRWSRAFPEMGGLSTPAVHDGTVYVVGAWGSGFTPGYLLALDPDTGDVRSSHRTAVTTFTGATFVDGLMYVRFQAATHAIDLATGDARWSHRHNAGPAARSPAPEVVDGAVYVPDQFGSGALAVLDAATGRVRRTHSRPMLTNPLVSGGVLYGGVHGTERVARGPFVALDAATFEERWANPLPYYAYSRPVLADGGLYLAANDNGGRAELGTGVVVALDPAAGTTRWTKSLPSFVSMAPTIWPR